MSTLEPDTLQMILAASDNQRAPRRGHQLVGSYCRVLHLLHAYRKQTRYQCTKGTVIVYKDP
jgi:hypothetical protein